MATGRQRPAPGQIIASDWGGKVWDQSVQTYLSTADRDAQFSNPADGAIVYIENTDVFYARVAGVWQLLTVGDTGWITGVGSSIFVPDAVNTTLNTSFVRVIGKLVYLYLGCTAKVAWPNDTNGNMANVSLGQMVAAYRPDRAAPPPSFEQSLQSGVSGRQSQFTITPAGFIKIVSTGSTGNFTVGEGFNVSGSYLI